MSIKERRERQKQATREGILAAALQIAQKEGWGAVTIRRVAEIIEYSPPIIYEYFRNKDALLEELQERGFALLEDKIRAAGSGTSDARERLLNVGDAYLQFAFDQPELYRLMHGWDSASVDPERTLARATRVAAVVEENLDAWGQAEGVTLTDPDGWIDIAWALLHGLISVETLDRIGGGKERTRQLARRGLESLLHAWATP